MAVVFGVIIIGLCAIGFILGLVQAIGGMSGGSSHYSSAIVNADVEMRSSRTAELGVERMINSIILCGAGFAILLLADISWRLRERPI